MIIPAILEQSADEVIRKINLIKPVAQTISIDIIDGEFVDNKTATLQELYDAGIHKLGVPLEFDLMVANPREYMELCQTMRARRVFWHYAAAPDIQKMIAELRRFAFKKGVAMDPDTPIADIDTSCGCLDAIQVMGVAPGKQQQEFIPATVERVRQLHEHFPSMTIVVDGGVGMKNIRELAAAGATDFAVGSGIFGCGDAAACYTELNDYAYHTE